MTRIHGGERDAAASWRRALVGTAITAGVGCTAAISAAGEPAAAASAASAAPTSPAASAATCAACHGPAGRGDAGIPRLAGLGAAYLVAQMQAFRNGTRAHPVMEPIAASLDDAATMALAAHYAALPAAAAASAVAAPAAASASSPAATPNRSGARGLIASLAGGRVSEEKVDGQALAQRGNWKNGVPACAQCHARDGLGVGDAFPPLAGQPAVYLANQLRAWQQGTRRNDPMGLMRSVATRLSSAEIDAVAAHYASLPAAAPRVEPAPPAAKRRSTRQKERR